MTLEFSGHLFRKRVAVIWGQIQVRGSLYRGTVTQSWIKRVWIRYRIGLHRSHWIALDCMLLPNLSVVHMDAYKKRGAGIHVYIRYPK